jgi:membrane associated rhomboid family serine protease
VADEQAQEQQAKPRNRSAVNQANGVGALVIIGGIMGLLTAYFLFGAAQLSGVIFALLAMLLVVFSGAQIVAGIRIIRRTGWRFALWVLVFSGAVLLFALFKEPVSAVLALALDAFALLSLRQYARDFESPEEE